MKFLERHWWVIIGLVVLYFYATRQQPLGDSLTGDPGSGGPSSGVTGSYGGDTPSLFNFPAWLGMIF